MESEIARRKQRWIGAHTGKPDCRRLLKVQYDADLADLPPAMKPLANLMPQRTERAWCVYERTVQRLSWLKDDSVPYLDCLTGTEIFAEAFGCSVYQPPDNMPCARPLVFTAQEAGRLKVPGLDAAPLARMFTMADELFRRSGGKALVRTVDIQSPMDIAALIWEKSDFLLAMIEAPEAVKELAEKCHQLLVTFLEEWQRRYGREHVAHWPDFYMPYGITLSEDEIGVVNNEMFEEFFLPHLIRLSQRFGAIGMHCCANSRHQWESFAKIPNLRYLNLKWDLADRAYPFFAKTNIVQSHMQGDEKLWEHNVRAFPEACLCVMVWAKDADEAKRLVEKHRQ